MFRRIRRWPTWPKPEKQRPDPGSWTPRLSKAAAAYGQGNERAADAAARLLWRGLGGTNAQKQISAGERLAHITPDPEQPLLSRVIAVWCARPQATDAARSLLGHDIRVGQPDEADRITRIPDGIIVLIPPHAYVSAPADQVGAMAEVVGMTVVHKQETGNTLLRWHITDLAKGTFEP
jgi:hypothetical protein